MQILRRLAAANSNRSWLSLIFRQNSTVLVNDFPEEWKDIVRVLSTFRLLKSRIAIPGGSKSLIAASIDGPLNELGWREREFATAIRVDDTTVESPTHKVDCFKNKVGLEIEWNNKDPFFDRDLNNFCLLFELRAVSVGVIVTRCDELQKIFDQLGRGKSYGNSTTHMGKLLPRLNGGGGGGCPILVFGIRHKLYVDDIPDGQISALVDEFKIGRKSKWKTIGSTLARYIDPALLNQTPLKEEDDE